MKLTVNEINSLSIKLSNEAKKMQAQKVMQYENSKIVMKIATSVFKAMKSIPEDVAQEMLSYSHRNLPIEGIAKTVAYIRYRGPKAKTSTELKHEIILTMRSCQTIEEIIQSITLLA